MDNNTVSFEEFCNYMRDNIKKHMRNKDNIKDVRLINVEKAGCTLTGLNIVLKDSNVAPNFYLNAFYDKYTKHDASLIEIINEIVYHPCWDSQHSFENTDEITDWNVCRDRIVYRLVSTDDEYKPYLQSRLYKEYGNCCNFAIVYDIDVSNRIFDEEETAQIAVTDKLLKLWQKQCSDVTLDTIHDCAVKNTPALRPVKIVKISDILKDMLEIKDAEQNEELQDYPLYIVTNEQQMFGANAILYPDVYDDVCEMLDDDFYVVPSSTHEMLVVPQHASSAEDLYDLNKDVNETQIVNTEDFLSNDVYVFENDKLCSVANELKERDKKWK